MPDRWPLSELQTIKRAAVQTALRCGAADARVAPADADPATYEALRASFARGDLATWRYDESYARAAATPERLLEGAQAVICVAVPYRRPSPPDAAMRGRVSTYAWSGDYHRRVRAILRDVARVIDEAAGACASAIVCDTKPFAERAFAARAGLSWTGRNTNAIHPRFGSFVFLGEVVTTLPLPHDPPLRKSCGSCRCCIPACPTGALRGDYTIDATRCISDLTQRKDAIPRALRPLIGTWVWGCDLCQTACPPNRRAPMAADNANAPVEDGVASPPLRSLLRMRNSDFKRLYARTAMGWRGPALLRRNAAVALGNSGDRSAIPALIDALQNDAHPLVRGHAAWALGRLGSHRAVEALRSALESDADASVLEEVRAALEPYGCAAALQAT